MVIDDSLLETAETVIAEWTKLNHAAKFRSVSGTGVTKLIINELTPRLIAELRKAQGQLAQVREQAEYMRGTGMYDPAGQHGDRLMEILGESND